MARFHLVKGGVVANTVLWDAAPPAGAYPDHLVIDGAIGAIGWLWDGSALAPPPPAPAPVPASISRLQLILGMAAAGLITPAEAVAAAAGTAIPAVVEAVFASLPEAEATAARIRWHAMTEVERANPLVAAVAMIHEKTPAQMDQYFREWSQL
jgi:hypothetical protein